MSCFQVTWDSRIGKTDSDTGRQYYKSAQAGDWTVELGAVVLLDAEQENQQQDEEEEQQQNVFGLVQCMWQDEDGDRMAQVCWCEVHDKSLLTAAAAMAHGSLHGNPRHLQRQCCPGPCSSSVKQKRPVQPESTLPIPARSVPFVAAIASSATLLGKEQCRWCVD